METIDIKKIFNKKNKKRKNNEIIVKRNWKKIAIWSSVAGVAIAGIIPAIYFPIVLNQDHSKPLPKNLTKINEDKLIEEFKKIKPDSKEVWCLYIDIKGNNDSNFALHGPDDEGGILEKGLEGPFSMFISDESNYKFFSFYDVDETKATEMLSKFIFEAYKTGNNPTNAGTSFFEIGEVNGDDDKYDGLEIDWENKQQIIEVEKIDNKPIDGDVDEEYILSFGAGNSSSITSPMWLTFKGQNLVFISEGIDTDSPAAQSSDFETLMWETGKFFN